MSIANPKRVKASESAQDLSGVQEPTYTLTGLSEADLELLAHALFCLNDHATVGDDYGKIMTMYDRIWEAMSE